MSQQVNEVRGVGEGKKERNGEERGMEEKCSSEYLMGSDGDY